MFGCIDWDGWILPCGKDGRAWPQESPFFMQKECNSSPFDHFMGTANCLKYKLLTDLGYSLVIPIVNTCASGPDKDISPVILSRLVCVSGNLLFGKLKV